MTTDNRKNEPNKYAAFLARQNHQRDSHRGIGLKCLCGRLFDLDADHALHQVEEIMRAALVAAAGVAPQAESEELAWYKAAAKHSADSMAEARETLQMFADRVDPFVFDELSSVLDDQPLDYETGDVIGKAAQVLPSSTVDADALIREAKAEARGEALIDAVQAHRKLHETYGSTSVCHGGIGGWAMTPHCAEICDNINAHLTEISAWDALELEAVEFSRARAAEYREGSET